MVEYLILVGLISLVALVGFRRFGEHVEQKLEAQAGTSSTTTG